jgi:ATP-dependent DNA ligase
MMSLLLNPEAIRRPPEMISTIPAEQNCARAEYISPKHRDTIDTFTCHLAADYRKQLSKIFIALSPDKMDAYLGKGPWHVTRKYDGELCVLVYENGSISAYNSGGNVVSTGTACLACVQYAGQCIKRAGILQGVFAAELYVNEGGGKKRCHVFETVSALADASKHDDLHLAVFDIIQIDRSEWRKPFNETYQRIVSIFGMDYDKSPCTAVRAKEAQTNDEVKRLFEKWVIKNGSEGIVLRGNLPGMVKIKPRLTVDAAIVGFSETDVKGSVRTLLYALMREDGTYQVIGRTGNGLTAEQRAALYQSLTPDIIPSNYIEVDSNRAVFHLVKPRLVMELSLTDVLAENASGVIKNPVLEYNTPGKMIHSGAVPGYSFVSAVIERFRDDKSVNTIDTRLEQLSSRVYTNASNNAAVAKQTAQPSTILRREVYRKEGRGEMVMKFMMWKTNKEGQGYPAYVFSFTNYSSGRAEPLSLDVRISNNEMQIMALYDEFLSKNVKAGWTKL